MKFDQLWVIRGRQPVLWSVPFYVAWEGSETEATIYYAIKLLENQDAAVRAVMSMHARPYNGMWRISRDTLERIGHQTPGGKPEQYLVWERPKEYQKQEHQAQAQVDDDYNDFIDTIYQRGIGKDRAEVAWWWTQFCTQALDNLAKREKPVDMGFIRLHPSPYRRNWMAILWSRFKMLGPCLHGESEERKQVLMFESNFMHELASTDLLAINRARGYCYQYVEVEHRRQWLKQVRSVELARFKKLGACSYARHVFDGVRRRLRKSADLYFDWLAHSARPCAVDVESGYCGLFRLAPHRNSWGGKALHQTWLFPVVISNWITNFTPSCDVASLPATNGVVPQLPDIRPQTPKLRSNGHDVAQRGNGAGGADGLPLRHACQGDVASELLALGEDRRKNGLARPTQS